MIKNGFLLKMHWPPQSPSGHSSLIPRWKMNGYKWVPSSFCVFFLYCQPMCPQILLPRGSLLRICFTTNQNIDSQARQVYPGHSEVSQSRGRAGGFHGQRFRRTCSETDTVQGLEIHGCAPGHISGQGTSLKRCMHLCVPSSTIFVARTWELAQIDIHQQTNGYRRHGTQILQNMTQS